MVPPALWPRAATSTTTISKGASVTVSGALAARVPASLSVGPKTCVSPKLLGERAFDVLRLGARVAQGEGARAAVVGREAVDLALCPITAEHADRAEDLRVLLRPERGARQHGPALGGQVARLKVPVRGELGADQGACRASIAIAGERLYVRTEKNVFCVGARAGTR